MGSSCLKPEQFRSKTNFFKFWSWFIVNMEFWKKIRVSPRRNKMKITFIILGREVLKASRPRGTIANFHIIYDIDISESKKFEILS